MNASLPSDITLDRGRVQRFGQKPATRNFVLTNPVDSRPMFRPRSPEKVYSGKARDFEAILAYTPSSARRFRFVVIGAREGQQTQLTKASSAQNSQQSRTNGTSSERFNALVFGLGGLALFGLFMMLFAIHVLDKWTSQILLTDSVLLVGASIVTMAGIAWIIAAAVLLRFMVKDWRSSDRRDS